MSQIKVLQSNKRNYLPMTLKSVTIQEKLSMKIEAT